jgi:hypothetical protein
MVVACGPPDDCHDTFSCAIPPRAATATSVAFKAAGITPTPADPPPLQIHGSANATPSPAYPLGTNVGIATVDRLLDLVYARNLAILADGALFTTVPCSEHPPPVSATPPCESGVPMALLYSRSSGLPVSQT